MSGGAGAAEVVVVDGPDACRYLDSQCTQDLSGLAVGDEALTLLLDPQGGLVTVAVVTRTAPDALSLVVPGGTGARTVARLVRFAIRAQLHVHDPTQPDVAPAWLVEAARIDAGIPGRVELDRALVPHALDPSLRDRAVSFTKGCYPGQELVARMQSRGATPPYVLRRLHADQALAEGDPVGDAAFDGVVTSVVDGDDGWDALGVLHRRDAQGADVEVRTASGPVVARLR